MTRHHNDPEVMKRLLSAQGTWAIVGLSNSPDRVAYNVSSFVQDALEMRIVPVHPKAETVHGSPGVSRLSEIDGPVDVVNVFVRSELAGAVVDQAIEIGAKAVWLQLRVVDEQAAARAKAAGLEVVMNACPSVQAPLLGLI
jgi:predicted CoA-binding protein